MKRRSLPILLTFALVALGLTGSTACAQSVFSTRGLGFPLEPTDARSRGIGGVPMGIALGEINWSSPGGMVGLTAPGITASYQYDDYFAQAAAGDFEGNTVRFPMILAGFPLGERAVAFAGYGSFLDQNWRIQESDTLLIGGQRVPIVDQMTSDGGVVRLRLGGAYEIVERLGIGVAVDAYTGSVERFRGRIFPGEDAAACCRARWSYDGLGVTTGLHWSPSEATSLAASVGFGGSLQAASPDSVVQDRSYELPVIARGGASGRITQNTLIAVGGGWEGWSSVDAALAAEGGARDAWSAHAGVEWDGASIQDRPLPLRLGARTGTLPFRWDTSGEGDWATESAFTAGLGVVLAGAAVRPDIAVEVGTRGGDGVGIEEAFWRFSLSVRVLGR